MEGQRRDRPAVSARRRRRERRDPVRRAVGALRGGRRLARHRRRTGRSAAPDRLPVAPSHVVGWTYCEQRPFRPVRRRPPRRLRARRIPTPTDRWSRSGARTTAACSQRCSNGDWRADRAPHRHARGERRCGRPTASSSSTAAAMPSSWRSTPPTRSWPVMGRSLRSRSRAGYRPRSTAMPGRSPSASPTSRRGRCAVRSGTPTTPATRSIPPPDRSTRFCTRPPVGGPGH